MKERITFILYGILIGFLLKYIYLKYTGDINEVFEETQIPKNSDTDIKTILHNVLLFYMSALVVIIILEILRRII